VGTLTPLTWEISKELVADVKLVEEEEIIHAMQVFQQDEQLMVEGAAAAGLAAILSGKINVENKKVVLVITGRNIDADKYNKLVNPDLNKQREQSERNQEG
jgi:threonine dehydratase